MVLQDRTATPARLRYTHAMIAPTLQPFDRSAGTDFKAFGRLTSRRSHLDRFDNSLTQVTGQRFRHRRSPHRRINADRLAQPNRLGNPPDSNRAEHALRQAAEQPLARRALLNHQLEVLPERSIRTRPGSMTEK
jgi:hypothetical protein